MKQSNIKRKKEYGLRLIKNTYFDGCEDDSDDTSENSRYEGCYPVDNFPDITCDFEPRYGDVYYLVYVTYSTGDSFHTEDGRTDEVALFKDEQDAWDLYNLIKNDYKKYDDSGNYTSIPLVFKGKKYYTPWYGYFESLTDVTVLPILCGRDRDDF